MNNAHKGPHAKRMEDMAVTETNPEFAEQWITNTPTLTYSLGARDHNCTLQQVLELTLDEFNELKRHLAEMRGVVQARSGGPA